VRRLVIWGAVCLVAALVIVVATVEAVAAHLEPLGRGFTAPFVQTSGTGWYLSTQYMEPPVAVLKYQEGAQVRIRFPVANRSSSTIRLVDLDRTVRDMREITPPCYWHPTSGRVLSAGLGAGEMFDPLPPPYDLKPQDEMVIEMSGRLGEPGATCQPGTGASGEPEVPLRFTWHGITETQRFPIGLKLVVTTVPESARKVSTTPLLPITGP
jgi:hypothetical protein